MHAIYVLWSEKLGKRYVGSSMDPLHRLTEHNSGKSVFTSRGSPWALKYLEYYETRGDAVARERFLKTGAGRIFLARVLGREPGYPEKEIPLSCLKFMLM